MEREIENTEVVSADNIQVEVPNEIEILEGKKDYEVRAVKKEYTIIGDNIFIPSMYEDAPPWLKEFIDTTIDVAVTNRDQSLIDRMEAILTAMDYVPKNQYTEQINQIVGEDGIINSRIATLNSNLIGAINTTNATIAEINLTYASKDEAAAIATNVITASLSGSGEIGSALIQLQEAYATLESTTAQSISMLESVMEGEIAGNAAAMEAIRTYVGIDEAGASTGTGLLANVQILQKQNDGVIETVTGTYDVMINPQDPNLAELVLTAEPYASWKAQDVSGIDTRLAHIGDVYIKYNTASNGAREYIASYKFIRTTVDSTSPYSTDSDGFTWALIIDQAAQDAYQQSLNAYDLADNKRRVFTTTPAGPIDEGDLWVTGTNPQVVKVYKSGNWELSDTQVDNFISVTYAPTVTSLQNQIDGKIESWYTLSTNNPKSAWTDAPTRAKHDGDMWYQTDTKLSYYYSSSTNSWNLIDDAKAVQALADAATAQATADGKISSYYMSTLAAANAMSNAWTATEKTNNIGDLVVVWNDSTLNNNGTWRWNGTNWITTRDKKLIALASDVTNLSTELTNGTNTWSSADSTLENSLRTEISDKSSKVEAKWAYNSIVNINGVYKKSGFGLSSNYTSGNGTISNPYVSEFWIDASKLKFTNSSMTGSIAPFTIDASGAIPKVTFNGTLTVLSTVNGVGGVTPTGFSSLGFFNTDRDQNAIGAVNNKSGGYGVSGIGTNTSSSVGVHGRGIYGVLGETIQASGYWGLITQQRCYAGQGFSSPVTTISFTGGHTCFSNDDIKVGDILEIVSGYLITIDQSYTIVTTATSEKSKRVFGVASKVSDDVEANLRDYAEIHEIGDDISTLGEYKEEYKPFINNLINNNYKDVTANSIGEGGINVCSINGDIENGDYITSSRVVGKGMKQDDDLLHNYTVAKALEDVIWANETVGERGCFEQDGYKCKMIACTYHAG